MAYSGYPGGEMPPMGMDAMDYDMESQTNGSELSMQALKDKQKRWRALQSKRFAVQKRFGFENTQKAELPPGRALFKLSFFSISKTKYFKSMFEKLSVIMVI